MQVVCIKRDLNILLQKLDSQAEKIKNDMILDRHVGRFPVAGGRHYSHEAEADEGFLDAQVLFSESTAFLRDSCELSEFFSSHVRSS